MASIPFLKKINFPALFGGSRSRVVGIDVGMFSTKVIQLRYDRERAILETYGELLNSAYFKDKDISGAAFLRSNDNDFAALLKDILRASNVTTREGIFSVPASSSFITPISLPFFSEKEIENTIPFEARKFIPIPISEVVLNWEILETNQEHDRIEVLLTAVPREVVDKFKRVASLAGIHLASLEVETFSVARALVGRDPTTTAILDLGQHTSNIIIADRAKVDLSHTITRGSGEISRALERGLGVSSERAEGVKRDVGLSEKIEEREIVSAITPLLHVLFSEVERVISLYNRKSPRHIQKLNITGGGSNLKGIIEFAASFFGIEVVRGNPFSRLVVPAFMQPILRDIGPNFSTAIGLALHREK